MQLNQRQAAVIHDWVQRKGEHPTCQVCQSRDWRIGQLIVARTDQVLDDVTVMPDMVQVICRGCAHVMLFDVHAIEGWNQAAAAEHDPRSAIM